MTSIFSILFVLILTTTGCSHNGLQPSFNPDNFQKTELLYNQFIEGESPNIAQLNLFFNKMPKGGDLHHHYSGSIYAETYLDWTEAANYLINKNTFKIVKDSDTKDKACCISVRELRSDTELYRKLLTLWSDKDYQNHYHQQPPPDVNFFNSFGYFGPISQNYGDGLKLLRQQAIKEKVSYIETMLSSVGYSMQDTAFDENVRKTSNPAIMASNFDELSSKLEADPELNKKVDEFVHKIEMAHQGMDDDRFMMRYQTYASRNGTPSVVFSALYSAFKAVEKNKLLVGINFVGPENGIVAIGDYNLHMRMIAYLRQKFPGVNLALHAGELTLGMVPPKELTFHIAKAIDIAGAQRIGHGVDLPYEEDPTALLRRMKEKSVVEINFTSNEFILGVKEQEHPYMIYRAYDVPMVISSDDSGVSRNNLSAEYVLLARRYKPSYQTIKNYVFNSIRYAFLSEELKPVLSSTLNARFEQFEAEMAAYSDLVLK